MGGSGSMLTYGLLSNRSSYTYLKEAEIGSVYKFRAFAL
jgi:hypothetical protein